VLRSAQVDFRILGPLEVWDGDRQLDLVGSKRRAVLAVLLLHANEVVSADRLIDQLWGEKAPRNAAAALQTHVSRLRKELGAEVVATRAWGYVLRTEPGAIDLERFQRLVAEAENLPARERAEQLREALALWRGRPLDDLAFEPALAKDIARLEELRLAVLENRIDADLEAGNHNGIVGDLEALIAENPLRERLRGQLILALYRSGRQAEALEVYRETRRVLADELGLDPSPELRELERAILQQDPALAATPASTGATAESGPRPGRRRRLYLGAVAVVLLGTIAAVAAIVSTGGRHVAQLSSPSAVRTVTTTRASAVSGHGTTTHLHAQVAVHPIVRGGKRATATGSASHMQVSKPSSSQHQRQVRPSGSTTQTATTATTQTATTAVEKQKRKPSAPPNRKKPVRIADGFSDPAIDTSIWTTWANGGGATADQSGGQLVFSIPADATFESRFNSVGINAGTKCRFPGNFDARIDYALLLWPAGNGAAVSLAEFQAGPIDLISRTTSSKYGDFYNAWPDGGSIPLADTSGSLRITRSNGVVRTFFLHHGQWRELGTRRISGEIWIGMMLSSNANEWQQMSVSAHFDNFLVTALDATCPAGSDPRNP
jgi:DNA-binding SARP family transcriptional activator